MKISRNKLSCLKLFQMDSFFVDGDNWSKSRITFVKQNPQRMEVNGTGAFPPVSISFFFFVATSVVNKLGSLLCHFIGHSVWMIHSESQNETNKSQRKRNGGRWGDKTRKGGGGAGRIKAKKETNPSSPFRLKHEIVFMIGSFFAGFLFPFSSWLHWNCLSGSSYNQLFFAMFRFVSGLDTIRYCLTVAVWVSWGADAVPVREREREREKERERLDRTRREKPKSPKTPKRNATRKQNTREKTMSVCIKKEAKLFRCACGEIEMAQDAHGFQRKTKKKRTKHKMFHDVTWPGDEEIKEHTAS